VRRGAEYWAATSDTLKLLPRLRSEKAGAYRLAVEAMSKVLVDIFDRHFVVPDVPHWSHKLGFLTELCDVAFADAIRTEGHISEKRLVEAETLGRTYLAFHLPADLPAQQKAS